MGWRATNGIVMLATLVTSAVQAADSPQAGGAGLPDLQLLEFIGQWETDQGEWISPEQLMNDGFGQLLDTADSQPGQEPQNVTPDINGNTDTPNDSDDTDNG